VPECKTFSEVLKDKKIEEIFKKNNVPKFLFLDPFSYSSVESEEIKNIMKFPCSEVLLFSPTFLAYRFTSPDYSMPTRLKNFLEDFTDKGVCIYQDIYDFNKSIKNNFQKRLGLEFVRPILIDIGKNKNTLFFISGHITGMMLMNKIFLKKSYDGRCLRVSEIKRNKYRPMLFKKEQVETKEFIGIIDSFQKQLIDELKKRKSMNNVEIVEFTAKEGFLPKHANQILIKLKKDNKIKIEYLRKGSESGLYIAEDRWRDRDILCLISFKMI